MYRPFICSRMVEAFCFLMQGLPLKEIYPKENVRVQAKWFSHARKFRYHGCVEMKLLAFKFCGFVTALLFKFHFVTYAK